MSSRSSDPARGQVAARRLLGQFEQRTQGDIYLMLQAMASLERIARSR